MGGNVFISRWLRSNGTTDGGPADGIAVTDAFQFENMTLSTQATIQISFIGLVSSKDYFRGSSWPVFEKAHVGVSF